MSKDKKGYILFDEFVNDTPPDGIDLNCDGKITLEEFVEFGKMGPQGPPPGEGESTPPGPAPAE